MGTLTFRSLVISGSDPDICLDLVEGLSFPDVRGKDWVVPRLDGRTEGNRRLDTLILPIQGVIKGSGTVGSTRQADFQANVQSVMDVMDPTLSPGALVLADYLGVDATIQARCRSASPGKVTNYRGSIYQLWAFELESIAPVWDFGS